MDTKPNAWVINKTTKNEEKNVVRYNQDEKIVKILEAQEKRNRENRQEKFKKWLERKSIENLSIYDILNNLCIDIENIVTDSGFTISNKKILRDEVATFIYKESYPDAKEKYL